MADKTYMIHNNTKYNVGFHRPGDIEVNLAPGKFISLTEAEIGYEAFCMHQWLADGVFYCEDERPYEMLGITREAAIVSFSEDEIVNKLKAPMKQFTVWLDEITSSAALEKIFEVAVGYDALPLKKAEMIESKTGKTISIARKMKEAK